MVISRTWLTTTGQRQGALAGLASLLISAIWMLFPQPISVAIICAFPVAAIAFISRPFVTVLLFVLFSFFRIHELFPPLYDLKIPLTLSAGALGALVWHVGISRQVNMYWRSELTMLSLFFGVVVVGLLLASNRAVAFAYFNSNYWKIMVMCFAITWLSRSQRDFLLASRLITLAGLLVAAVALHNKINAIGLVEGSRVTIGRSFGSVLGDPNDLALVLLFPMSFAVSISCTPALGTINRLLGIISVPLLFMALLATQSRGGLIGVIAVFGVFAYRRVKSKLLLINLGVILVVGLYLLAGISGRASGGSAEAGVDESAMGRIYAWQAAFNMAMERPLTGVGIDNFVANYFFYSPHWDGLNHAVHSTWFGVLAETGFVGLIVFVAVIVMLLKTANHTLETLNKQPNPALVATVYTSAEAVLAGLVGTVAAGTFLTQGFTWPLYILAALVISIAHWTEINCPASASTTPSITTS